MLFRSLLAALALTAAATDSEAGPFRRRAQPTSQPSYQPAPQPTYQSAYQSPITPSAVTPAGGVVISSDPVVTPAVEYTSSYTPAATTIAPVVGFDPAGGMGGDALSEVNAKRAARGLRPFLRDEGLTRAATGAAQFRAERGLFGHTSNDFSFVPPGTSASSAGCAAYPASYGWMSCCVYDNYTYGGAAYVTGRDGKRYMHLFVR